VKRWRRTSDVKTTDNWLETIRTSVDWITRGWLWLCIALFPIFALAGGLGFQISAFGLGIGGLLVLLVNPSELSRLKSPWVLIYIAFLAWVWIASLWSAYKDPFFSGNGMTLFFFSGFLVTIPLIFNRLSESTKWYMRHAVIAFSVLGAGLILLDILSGYGLAIMVEPVAEGSNLNIRQADAEMNLGRGIMTYIQLAWPLAMIMTVTLTRGWIMALAFLAALILAAELNRLSLSFPTLVVSGLFALLAWRRPRFGLMLALALAMASLLLAPAIGWLSGFVSEAQLNQIPMSWEHRLRMWHYSFERILERPLFGHGFDVSRTYAETYTARDGRDIVIVSLHPHNVGLQLWMETGFVSILMLCGFVAALTRPLLRIFKSPLRSACLTSLIVATTTHGATTIGAWQYWWWGVTVLSACLILFISQNEGEQIQLQT